MLKAHPIFVRLHAARATALCLTALLLSLTALAFGPEVRQISVYAPQINYQVEIFARNGVDYVGLTDLLEPLGRSEPRVESHIQGKKFILAFNGSHAEFRDGKRQVRIGADAKLELSGDFLLADGRGYIPLASVVPLLSRLTGQPADFHSAPRRLFVGSPQFHLSAELRHAPSRLVLSFPAPVNPSVLVEKGRVHLFFRREPLVSNGSNDEVTYNDPFLLSTRFAEQPGGTEFIAAVQQPATVAISEDGRTITIAADVIPPPVPPPALPVPSSPPALVLPPAPAAARPAPPVRPFVILDPAHGGKESGSVLSATLVEKTVTLALARRLQKELDARGIPVVLTRVADNSLSWEQRAVSANTSHAALYVSLHSSATGHGVHLYTALLPATENAAPDRHSFVPWELAQSPYLQRSVSAAAALAAECVSEGLPAHSSAAPVRPLNNVTLAAVAVEVSPLGSSADDVAAPEYLQKVAAALATAIAALRGQLVTTP